VEQVSNLLARLFSRPHFQILPNPTAKMFTGVFKTQCSRICAEREHTAASLRCAPICSDTARVARRSPRRSQFRNHTDRAARNPRTQTAFRRFARFTKSIWKLSHSRRIPSAFGTHPVPIRHPFLIPTVAPTPKPALLAHIGNLGNLQTPPCAPVRQLPFHRSRLTAGVPVNLKKHQ
jgi:hypothetical protein